MDTGYADQVKQFVRAATDESPGPVEGPFLLAKRMLARDPALAKADVYTALVLGDVETVRRQVERDPRWVSKKGGPQPRREPLLYVTYSKFHRESPEIAEGLLATARLLLDAGADPDAKFTNDFFDSPLGALVGACGTANFPAMADLLLDRGTTIDDNESLYHSTEHADTRCLELLLARGANPARTNALNHAFDVPGLERARLLLEHGADPNEVYGRGCTPLHMAIERGREIAMLELLVAHGADVHAQRGDGRSPYRVALQHGH
ncbi:MAG: ankyrin repeat domain-containing protein, partial [Thermoanaerobaculia bacterium]